MAPAEGAGLAGGLTMEGILKRLFSPASTCCGGLQWQSSCLLPRRGLKQVEGILKLSSAQSRLAAGGYSGTPAVSLPRRGLKHGETLDGIHLVVVHSVESI